MGMLWPTLEFVLGLAGAITLLAGGHEVLTHRISVGDFVAFNVYMVMLTWPIIALAGWSNLVQRGSASVIRIDECWRKNRQSTTRRLIRQFLKTSDFAARSSFAICPLPIRIQPGREPKYCISLLKIPAGSSLAVVGPTGSGKSTLVNLIPRLYDAPPGSILIDGRPLSATIRSMSARQYRLCSAGDISL